MARGADKNYQSKSGGATESINDRQSVIMSNKSSLKESNDHQKLSNLQPNQIQIKPFASDASDSNEETKDFQIVPNRVPVKV